MTPREKLRELATEARDAIGRNQPQARACFIAALDPQTVLGLLNSIDELEGHEINRAVCCNKMEEQSKALRAGLEGIANDPACSYLSLLHDDVSNEDARYATGVIDGRRCAAEKASATLAAVDKGEKGEGK